MTPNNSFYEVCIYIYIHKFDKFGGDLWLLILCVFPCGYYLSNSSKTFISQNRLKQRFCLFIKIWNVPFLQQSIKRRKSRMASEYIYKSNNFNISLLCRFFLYDEWFPRKVLHYFIHRIGYLFLAQHKYRGHQLLIQEHNRIIKKIFVELMKL